VTVIALRNATKRFPGTGGRPHTAVRDLTFEVEAGEFVAVVGPTGCGKSTTLSMVSGLDRPSEGSVKVGGREVGYVDAPYNDDDVRNAIAEVAGHHAIAEAMQFADHSEVELERLQQERRMEERRREN